MAKDLLSLIEDFIQEEKRSSVKYYDLGKLLYDWEAPSWIAEYLLEIANDEIDHARKLVKVRNFFFREKEKHSRRME